MVAGVAAVALERGVDRFSRRSDWSPAPLTLPVGVLVLLVLGAILGGGYATVAASSASVSDVEATVVDRGPASEETGLVVVEGDPTELRLTVTAPDGTTAIERLGEGDLREGAATIELPYWRFDASLRAGTYAVELSSLTGTTVDRTTYTIETEPTPSLRQVEVAPPGVEPDLDVPDDATVRATGSGNDTRIATVVTNEGDAPGEFATRLRTGDGEFVTVQDVVIGSGQDGANVVALSEDEVEQVHRGSDGVVEVEILFDGDVVTTESVTLPEPDSE